MTRDLVTAALRGRIVIVVISDVVYLKFSYDVIAMNIHDTCACNGSADNGPVGMR